jgi:hypothetical protein
MGAAYYKGLTIGSDWGGAFGQASRQEKRRMVARLARMSNAFWNEFVRGVQEGIAGRAEARYDTRRAGFNVRSVGTDRLAAALERLT